MSLRREQNAELERVYNDFMNYYHKHGLKPKHYPEMIYPCYDYDHDGDCDNDEYYHKKHHHKPMPKPMPHHPHHPHKFPYNILPYPLYPNVPYSPLYKKRVLEDNPEYTEREIERSSKVLEPTAICNTNQTYPIVYTPDIMKDTPRVDNSKTVEQKYYKAMFSDISKTLQPYVAQVIKNNNYVGSPINDKYFDRESLAQLVQEVLDRAKNNPKLISFIQNLDPKVREIMKNLVEALVLGELFVIHRPNTKLNEDNMMNVVPYNSQNARYNNMYGDPKNSKPLGENMDNYLCEPCEELKPNMKPKMPMKIMHEMMYEMMPDMNMDMNSEMNKNMNTNMNTNINTKEKTNMEMYENKVNNKSRNPLFNEIQNFSN